MALAQLEKCRVTGPVLKPDGTPCYPATITFTLSRRDRDDGITIMPAPVAVDTDADGNIEVDLWPNAEGMAGTFYVASVVMPQGERLRTSYPPFNLVVPVAPSANLSEISELVPPASVDDARAAVILAQQAAADAQEAAGIVIDNLGTLQAIETNLPAINTVAGSIGAVQVVAAREDDIEIVADIAGAVLAVAEERAPVLTVATNIGAVNLAAENMALIQAAPGNAQAAEQAKDDAEALVNGVNAAKINWRGAYAAGTAYAARDAVSFGNSSWIAKVATTGNAPPALPTTQNTWWELMASKGDAYETYGVSIYRAAGILTGGYYAERYASAGSTQGRLVAEIIAGNVGAEVDFYVEVNGVMAYGPVTVVNGTQLVVANLALAVPVGAKISFIVTRMVGNVTEFFAKTYGALS